MGKLPKEFERLKKIKNQFKKRLFFVGILTKYLKREKIKPIVVGGHAVEFYTGGYYSTFDIDIIADGYNKIGNILEKWGFKKEGRHWYNEKLQIAIEIPSNFLEPKSYNYITEIKIDNLNVYMIGIEDIIVDRLNAYKWWNSRSDREWAKKLLKIRKEEIDFEYLNKKVKKEKIEDVFNEVLREIENE